MGVIGVIEYLTKLDPSGAERGMAELGAKTESEMKALDGLTAVLELRAENRDLDDKLEKANIDLKKLDAQRAEAKLTGDDKDFTAAYDRVRARIAQLKHDRAVVQFTTSGVARVLADAKAVEAAAGRTDRATKATTGNLLKQQVQVTQLRRKYNDLYTEISRLESIKPPRGSRTEGQDLHLEELRAQAALAEHELGRLGKSVEDITKDNENARGPVDRLRSALTSLGSARLSLGPISGTIRQFAIGAALLAPILTSLVGSAVALTGAIGAGLVGAFGIAAGAGAGFLAVTLGLLPSLKQLGTEAKTLPSLVGPLQHMRDSLSGGIRQSFFQDAHQGVKTLQADFPAFKSGATAAFGAASKGFQAWMSGLRSPEAQSILKNILGNFKQDIGPTMAGLGSLTTAFSRFISIASGSGPGISKTFEGWAAGIEHSTRAGSGFADRVNSLVGQAKTLGSTLAATGRLTVAFFGAGAKSGQGLLQSLTANENKMTEWIHSVSGQQSLGRFFSDAADNTRQLFSALAPLISTFVKLSGALAPVTTGMLQFATFIGRVIGAVASLAPARVTLEGFGVALGGLFLLSKVSGWVKTAASGFGVMAGAEDAATAATAANTAALEANTAAFAENDLARGVGSGEAALGGLAGATEGVGLAATESALPILGLGVALGALIVYATRGKSAIDRAHDALGHYDAMVQQARPGLAKLTQTSRAKIKTDDDATKAQNDLYRATERFVKGDGSLGAVQAAQVKANVAGAKAATNTKAQATAQQALVTSSEKVAQAQKAVAAAQSAVRDSRTPPGASGRGGAIAGPKDADPAAIKALTAANNDLSTAEAQQTIDQINQARAMNGLNQLAPSVTKNFQALQDTVGRTKAAKIGLTADPSTTAQIAKMAADLQKLGVTKRAKLIIDGAKSPEEALKGLQKLDAKTLKTKILRISKDAALASALAGLNKVDAKQLKQKALRILTNTGSVTQALAFLQGKKLPDKEQKFKPGSPAAVVATYNQIVQQTPDRVVQIQFHGSKTGNWSGASGHFAGGAVPGFAGGGWLDTMMNRAYDLAGRKPGLDPVGGATVRSPRYVVGEEAGRTEYIITDNPAYRASNLNYLQDAARALGQAIVPGYKGGKGSKAKRIGPSGLNLDDATAPNSAYQKQEDAVNFDAANAELIKRHYDLQDTPTTIDAYTSAITKEYDDYGTLATTIQNMLSHASSIGPVSVPGVSKKTKTAKERKQQKAQQAKQDAANAWNSSLKSDTESLTDELNTINNITRPNLQLDIFEANNAAAANAQLDAGAFNSARYDLFKTFSSNISAPTPGGSPGAPMTVTPGSTPPSPGYLTPSSAPSGSGGAGGGAGGNTTIVNNFAAPPPDPLTWTAGVSFNMGVAT